MYKNSISRANRSNYTTQSQIKKPKLKQVTIENIKIKGVSQEQINFLKQCFKEINCENLSSIQLKDLKKLLNEPQLKKNHQFQLAYLNWLQEEHNLTQIDQIRFIDIMTKKFKYLNSKEDIKLLFSLFDDQVTGYISIKNIRAFSQNYLGQQIKNHQELRKMIQNFDIDQDGLLDQQQFKNIFETKTFINTQ